MPVTTSSTPNHREPATGFAVIPYIQGVTEPIKRILKSHKNSHKNCLKSLFRLWGIFLPNLRILSRQNNELTLFLLFRAMTVITSISDNYQNVNFDGLTLLTTLVLYSQSYYLNHSKRDSDWLIAAYFMSVQSTLTALLFALERKFVLKIESNAQGI